MPSLTVTKHTTPWPFNSSGRPTTADSATLLDALAAFPLIAADQRGGALLEPGADVAHDAIARGAGDDRPHFRIRLRSRTDLHPARAFGDAVAIGAGEGVAHAPQLALTPSGSALATWAVTPAA